MAVSQSKANWLNGRIHVVLPKAMGHQYMMRNGVLEMRKLPVPDKFAMWHVFCPNEDLPSLDM